MTKVFTATLGTETNTFSPITTGDAAFRELLRFEAGEAPDDLVNAFVAPLVVLRRRGFDVRQGLIAFAQPAGSTPRRVYEALRDQLLDDLKAALPVDFVALGLHGAMIADGYDDCEGDLLARVRAIVGPDVPVGAELDPHCHLSEAMTRFADVLVCFKENPHTDFLERAEDLVDILDRQARGEVRPVMSVYDCRMIDFLNTRMESMRAVVDRAKALEDGEEVLSVSIVHGFSRADVPDMGTKVLVVTNDAPARGEAVGREIGEMVRAQRGRAKPAFVPLDEAIDRALAAPRGPVVLADAADNAGGGAPSDSTYVIRALLDRGFDDFAAALIWDPQAVGFAMDAGEGATMSLRVGGKACRLSGQPLDLDVVVERIVTDGIQRVGPASGPLGRCVGVRAGGAHLVLTDLRNQVFSTDVFTTFGIDPLTKKVLVVKSAQHFRTAFEPIAAEVIVVDAPGVCDLSLGARRYTRIQRPKWPFDPEPAG